MFSVEDEIFWVLYYIVITKYSYFIIIMSKLIYSFIYSWIACIVFVLFLMASESYIEYIEYQTINHTWYNVNQLVNESINIL